MAENLILKEMIKNEKEEFLAHHFLLHFLYGEKTESLKKLEEMKKQFQWDKWCSAVLIETDQDFFDGLQESFAEGIYFELRRMFYYLNLNSRQSLLLFGDKNCDYQLIAKQICIILRRKYVTRFYLSISRRFEGIKELPEVLNQLEQRMEEKYYYKEDRIFFSEEDELNSVGKEVQDSQIMQLISEDISRKDTEHLWEHFGYLKRRYQDNTSFSAMYVKFVFSNVVQEIFQEDHFSEDGRLEKEIDILYACNSIGQILKVTEGIIEEYEAFIKNSLKQAGKEIAVAREYIEKNCEKDLDIELLAKKVGLPCGYFSFVFRKETGMSINCYLHIQRMEKIKRLLSLSNLKWEQISREAGFRTTAYCYYKIGEYLGEIPDEFS